MRCLRCGAENPDEANNCIRCKEILKRVCPRCKAVNHPNQVFCGNCGLKLVNICPKCKTQNHPLQKFCGRCGLKIINFCPQCGMNNPMSQKFCGNCSSKLFPDAPSRGKHGQVPPSQHPLRNHQSLSSLPLSKPLPQQPSRAHIAQQQGGTGQSQQRRPVDYRGPQEAKRELRAPQQKQLKGMPELSPEEIRRRENLKQRLKQSSVKIEQSKAMIVEAQQKPKLERPIQTEPQAAIITKEEAIKAEIKEEITPTQISTEDQIKSPFEVVKPQEEMEEEREEILVSEALIEKVTAEKAVKSEDKVKLISKVILPKEEEPQEIFKEEYLEEAGDEIIVEDDNIEEVADKLNVEQYGKEKSTTKGLDRFAILTVEIINYNRLAEALDVESLQNVRNRVWNIVLNFAQQEDESFIEVAENIGLVALKHPDTKEISCLNAIKLAENIFNQSDDLNSQLQSTLNVQIKLKIGIALNDSDNASQLERSIASAWSIVVSDEIRANTKDLYEYDSIGPLPIGNRMVTFYKLKVAEVKQEIQRKKIEPISEIEEEIIFEEESEEIPASQQPLIHQKIGIQKAEQDEISLPSIKTKLLKKEAIVGNLINSCSLVNSTGQGQFISIVGEDGMGKSTIIAELMSSLNNEDFTWLITRCNYQDQIMPLSAIKDLLRNLFALPGIIYNRNDAINAIKSKTEELIGPNDQICHVLNSLLLGDDASGLSKDHIVSTVMTLIQAITQKTTAIMLIDDLEAIDNSSFEIIESLIDAKILDQKALFIATFHPNLNLVEVKPDIIRSVKYSQMHILPIKDEDFDAVVAGIVQTNLVLPDDIQQRLIVICQGNPYAIESALCYMFEIQVIANTAQGLVYNNEAGHWDIPESLQEIVKQRLMRLNQYNPNAFYLMQVCAALGPKFSLAVLQNLLNNSKEVSDALQALNSQGYLILEDQNKMRFKHNIIWELMYYSGISDEAKPQFHFNILTYLENLYQTGGRMDVAYLAFQAEQAGKKRKALNYWNICANQILALELHNGYCELMTRYINILEQLDLPNKDELKASALEEIAKVMHSSNPEMAIQTISQIIPIYQQKGNNVKLIELKGYNSCALERLGYYQEALDEIEGSLALLDPEVMPLERVLLMTSLIGPMEKMGKVGGIINTCSNDILPVLEKAIIEKHLPEGMSEEQMFKIYCNTKISFANAMLTIGHHEGFQIFAELMQEIQRRGLQDTALKVLLLSAKAHALRGEINNANQILNQTREYLQQTSGINKFSLMWGEAGLLYSLESENYESLKALTENVKMQAKKLKDYPAQALVKLCEGVLLSSEGFHAESLENFNEMVQFASKYKLATYALEGWYNLALLELQAKNYDRALAIAQNALEISKKPEIYNLHSLVELNRLIGEIFIKKGEVENSGVPLEEAWKIATELQNHSQIARVATAIGLMYKELLAQTKENKAENAQKAKEFMDIALARFSELGNNINIQRVEKHLKNLQVFCQINNVKEP